MLRNIQIILLLVCILLLLYGLFWEDHIVKSLSRDEQKALNGFGLIEYATYDGLILKEKELYDINSLKQPEVLKDLKECAT
jgi:hypothetical protein